MEALTIRIDSIMNSIKTRVSTNKTWTNLLHHIRFSPEDEMINKPTMDQQGIIHYDTLQKQLVNVLSEAKDNMIPMAELFNIFVSMPSLEGYGSRLNNSYNFV